MRDIGARLGMVAGLVPKCALAADIGADHGRLGAWLLHKGICDRVQFIDISDKSLGKARELVRGEGLGGRAEFTACDGADGMDRGASAAIIAGVGAETIIGILTRGVDALRGKSLILQPNWNVGALRGGIAELGFTIDAEDIAYDGFRWYVAMRAVAGYTRLSPVEETVGPILLRDNHPRLSEYAAFHLRVFDKAIAGAESGAGAGAKAEARALCVEKGRWEEAMRAAYR